MRTKANWARMVVANFTMAVFYASVCSTTCAIGFCPNQVHQTAGHDCEQTPDQSKHQTPDNPDCPEHQHPGSFVTKSVNFSQFQLNVVDHLKPSDSTFPPVHGLPATFTDPAASEHAPPIVSTVPLYEQISVLRI